LKPFDTKKDPHEVCYLLQIDTDTVICNTSGIRQFEHALPLILLHFQSSPLQELGVSPPILNKTEHEEQQ